MKETSSETNYNIRFVKSWKSVREGLCIRNAVDIISPFSNKRVTADLFINYKNKIVITTNER